MANATCSKSQGLRPHRRTAGSGAANVATAETVVTAETAVEDEMIVGITNDKGPVGGI